MRNLACYMKVFSSICLILMFTTAFQPETVNTLPDLNLKSLRGETVNLASYGKNEKPTIISFWATWCKPCINELNAIADLYPDWQEEYGVELVAVSLDDARTAGRVRSVVNTAGWEYEILQDLNRDSQRAFNFQTPPYLLLVDAKGEIIYKHSGYIPGSELEIEDKLIEITAD